MVRVAVCLVGLFTLNACDGKLEPLVEAPRLTPIAVPGVHFVEPFDYHYPDEGFYDDIDDAVHISVARGQTEAGTFVYVPSAAVSELEVKVGDLRAADGSVFPPESVSVGVVLFRERAHAPNRLDMCWKDGIRRGVGSSDPRGFHQDCRQHLPLVPLMIVPDEIEALAQAATATGHITLHETSGARAHAEPNVGKQFWFTVNLPIAQRLNAPRTLFTGDITLTSGASHLAIPLKIEALNIELDTLISHGKHAGVMTGADPVAPEFREAVLEDLAGHGVNALRDALSVPDDYLSLRAHGFGLAINTRENLSDAELQQIKRLGYEPYVFGETLAQPGLFDGSTDIVPSDIDGAVLEAKQLHAHGALYGGAMRWLALQQIRASEPVDFWAHTLSLYTLDTSLFASEFDGLLEHLGSLRAEPSRRVAGIESHYAEVFNGQAPLDARLLMGFWLYRSGLDGGMPWGYTHGTDTNGFTDPNAVATAFPAEFHDATGNVTRRALLPSYTWEAYRAGVNDLRYALTAERLLGLRGSPEQRARFEALLAGYAMLYDANGDYLAYRKREGDVRLTRQALAGLVLELSQ